MKTLSIIIPTYNEQEFISELLERVLSIKLPNFKKEIIVVNDGSTDKTLTLIKKTIAKHPQANIHLISYPQNRGKGFAVKQGILASTSDIVLIQDADLEYDPNDYPLLLKPFLYHQADVVYGSRFISHQPHRLLYFWHFLGNKLLTTLTNLLTNLNLTDMETGFKAFRGNLIRQLAPHLQASDFGFEPEVTIKLAKLKNLKLYEVGISYHGRTYQQGKKITFLDGLKAIPYLLYFRYLNRPPKTI